MMQRMLRIRMRITRYLGSAIHFKGEESNINPGFHHLLPANIFIHEILLAQ